MKKMKNIAVYCASSTKLNEVYLSAARELGELMVENHLNLVYGAGNMGIMGEIADTMLAFKGEVVGVIPEFMVAEHWEHQGCTELVVVKDMHERKGTILRRSDALVVLPGGIGTMEEFMEVLTWKQLGLHDKPIVVLNTNGYYNKFLDFLCQMEQEHFLGSNYKDMLVIVDTPKQLMDALQHPQTWDTTQARGTAKI